MTTADADGAWAVVIRLGVGSHTIRVTQTVDGATSAFSLEALLPELAPLLAREPEHYDYCPEPEAVPVGGAVSPYAV